MSAVQSDISQGILFTDQYQLTMAQLYYRHGMHEMSARFEHFFRAYPDYGGHKAGYCINAGLEWLVHWIQNTKATDNDIEQLRGQKDEKGNRIFADDFLQWLKDNGDFLNIDLSAIPEGRTVHPFVPLTSVQGPLALCQILETPLLNFLNYQTLIATKAARVKQSSCNRPVLEFGLRRGPSLGANAGTRGALIGGADFTSNTGVSQSLGLPPKGTHAHSMVQTFLSMGMSELDAFQAYADTYPNNCILLVDTIDTLNSGIPNAIKVFEKLRKKGYQPKGVRLDSGDLAFLSIKVAQMLDAAGFTEVSIVLSNDLDELVIWQIISQIRQEAPRYEIDADRIINRLMYGVGTKLITSRGSPALGAIYKLMAVKHHDRWEPTIKISDSVEKTPIPGQKQAWRIYDKSGRATADLLAEEGTTPGDAFPLVLRHPWDHEKRRVLSPDDVSDIECLTQNVVKDGRVVYNLPAIQEIRELRYSDLEKLYPGVRRIVNPHRYHVSVTEHIFNMREELLQSNGSPSSPT